MVDHYTPDTLRSKIESHLIAAGWGTILGGDHWHKGPYRLRFEDAIGRQVTEETIYPKPAAICDIEGCMEPATPGWMTCGGEHGSPDPIRGMRAIGRIYKEGRMFKMQWLPGVYVDDDAFEGGEVLYAPIVSGEAGSGNAPTPATTSEAGSVLPPLTPLGAGAPPPPCSPLPSDVVWDELVEPAESKVEDLMDALAKSVDAAKAARKAAPAARSAEENHP